MDKIIITEIVRFVHQCLQEGNHEFFHQWMKELSSLEMQESPHMPQSGINFPFSFEHGVYEIIRAASKNQMSTGQLIDNLQVAYEMAQYTLDTQPLITPVWTGPVYENQLISTQTFPVVKELIDAANQEIFIVGYSFSFSYGELKHVLSSILDAAKRNCRITLIVNNEERNFQTLKNNWNEDSLHLLNIYSWLGNNSTGYTSLHSKLIITDRRKMLLTSANFSYHGFVKNIETGVIIEQHEVVNTFWRQFRSLLENNQIKKIF